jgi:integrase
MVSILKRRGRYMVNYRDALGRQRQPSFRTKVEAQDFMAKAIEESREDEPDRVVAADITFDDYAAHWLKQIAATVKASSLAGYEQRLRLHVLPALGRMKVRKLGRGRIKVLLTDKLSAGLSRESVRFVHATLRAMLASAVEDGVRLSNPAARLGKVLNLVRSKETRQQEIKAFDKPQLSRFLAAAREKLNHYYALFFIMSRTGLRIGEALVLQWTDLDFEAKEIRVERAISNTGVIDTPKSGHGRTVDMSAAVRNVLREQRANLAEAWLKLKPEMDENATLKPSGEPIWVFPSDAWTPMDHSNVGKAFHRALKAAGLPGHFSPHSLRHTYASLLLADGVSPAYVQEQLGHASIELTVGTYGRWLRKRSLGAVDRLDDLGPETIGGKLVAEARTGSDDDSQAVDGVGDPPWTRTMNPEIKSLLLYQLS